MDQAFRQIQSHPYIMTMEMRINVHCCVSLGFFYYVMEGFIDMWGMATHIQYATLNMRTVFILCFVCTLVYSKSFESYELYVFMDCSTCI